MTKRLLLMVLVISLLAATGCSGMKVDVDISCPIDFYSPMMSSVPGMPIDVVVTVPDDRDYDVTIIIEADFGTMLEWGSDMKVNAMGKSVKYHEGTRYWSPFDKEIGIAQSAELDIKVTVKAEGFDSVTRTNAHIKKNEDGMYVFEPED